MSTYANIADFKAYTYLSPMPSDAVIQRALNRAESDIDRYVPGVVDPDTALRINPSQILVWQLVKLNEATCAQAEYRILKGEAFFATYNNDEVVQGPDFTISGTQRRFSIAAATYLRESGLLLLATRAVP